MKLIVLVNVFLWPSILLVPIVVGLFTASVYNKNVTPAITQGKINPTTYALNRTWRNVQANARAVKRILSLKKTKTSQPQSNVEEIPDASRVDLQVSNLKKTTHPNGFDSGIPLIYEPLPLSLDLETVSRTIDLGLITHTDFRDVLKAKYKKGQTLDQTRIEAICLECLNGGIAPNNIWAFLCTEAFPKLLNLQDENTMRKFYTVTTALIRKFKTNFETFYPGQKKLLIDFYLVIELDPRLCQLPLNTKLVLISSAVDCFYSKDEIGRCLKSWNVLSMDDRKQFVKFYHEKLAIPFYGQRETPINMFYFTCLEYTDEFFNKKSNAKIGSTGGSKKIKEKMETQKHSENLLEFNNKTTYDEFVKNRYANERPRVKTANSDLVLKGKKPSYLQSADVTYCAERATVTRFQYYFELGFQESGKSESFFEMLINNPILCEMVLQYYHKVVDHIEKIKQQSVGKIKTIPTALLNNIANFPLEWLENAGLVVNNLDLEFKATKLRKQVRTWTEKTRNYTQTERKLNQGRFLKQIASFEQLSKTMFEIGLEVFDNLELQTESGLEKTDSRESFDSINTLDQTKSITMVDIETNQMMITQSQVVDLEKLKNFILNPTLEKATSMLSDSSDSDHFSTVANILDALTSINPSVHNRMLTIKDELNTMTLNQEENSSENSSENAQQNTFGEIEFEDANITIYPSAAQNLGQNPTSQGRLEPPLGSLTAISQQDILPKLKNLQQDILPKLKDLQQFVVSIDYGLNVRIIFISGFNLITGMSLFIVLTCFSTNVETAVYHKKTNRLTIISVLGLSIITYYQTSIVFQFVIVRVAMSTLRKPIARLVKQFTVFSESTPLLTTKNKYLINDNHVKKANKQFNLWLFVFDDASVKCIDVSYKHCLNTQSFLDF